MISGCSSTVGPTCDDYAEKNVFDRGSLVMDLMKAHGLDEFSIPMHENIDQQIESTCGKNLDPGGGDTADSNGSTSLDSAVNWKEVGL